MSERTQQGSQSYMIRFAVEFKRDITAKGTAMLFKSLADCQLGFLTFHIIFLGWGNLALEPYGSHEEALFCSRRSCSNSICIFRAPIGSVLPPFLKHVAHCVQEKKLLWAFSGPCFNSKLVVISAASIP